MATLLDMGNQSKGSNSSPFEEEFHLSTIGGRITTMIQANLANNPLKE